MKMPDSALQHRRNTVTAAGIVPAWSAGVFAALLSILLLAPAVSAQHRFTPRLSFDGFGALGISHSSEDRADFNENLTRPAGPGHSSTLNAGMDSRIAGQATFSIGARFKAVGQLMVEQDARGDYRLRAEAANVSYAITPDLSVRVGRIVTSAFMVADTRKVSYAHPWVRPPVELYGLMPLYSLDGADAAYRWRSGDWTARLGAATGRVRAELPAGSFEGRKLWTVNSTLTRGAFTGRLNASGGTILGDLMAPLFDGFRAFGPEGVAIADRFDVDDRKYRFASGGAEYDPGAWFALAEVAWFDFDSVLGERLAGYVTGGVRWRDVAPHVTYSRSRLLSESWVAGLPLAGLPPTHAHVATQLNDKLNALLNSAPVQQTLAVGGRWDLMPGVALKVQVDFVDVLGSSNGTFINLQPGFEPGGTARLLSVATAFMF
jgi:hypothetical protein